MTIVISERSDRRSPVGRAASAFAALGTGLLVGMLLGLSVSPTVAVFIGGVGGVLAILLGLNDRLFSTAKAIRVGVFGVATVAATCLGIWSRTHAWFSPSLESIKEEYTAVGFSEAEALDMIRRERGTWAIGHPGGDSEELGAGPVTSGRTTPITASVLFRTEVETSVCRELRTAYDDELPAAEVLNNFRLAGGLWAELADAVAARFEPLSQKEALFLVRDLLCEA